MGLEETIINLQGILCILLNNPLYIVSYIHKNLVKISVSIDSCLNEQRSCKHSTVWFIFSDIFLIQHKLPVF